MCVRAMAYPLQWNLSLRVDGFVLVSGFLPFIFVKTFLFGAFLRPQFIKHKIFACTRARAHTAARGEAKARALEPKILYLICLVSHRRVFSFTHFLFIAFRFSSYDLFICAFLFSSLFFRIFSLVFFSMLALVGLALTVSILLCLPRTPSISFTLLYKIKIDYFFSRRVVMFLPSGSFCA